LSNKKKGWRREKKRGEIRQEREKIYGVKVQEIIE
jgi:hypothetical protein